MTEQFEINAHTYVLKNNVNDSKKSILDDSEYIIPIYQRPYSWKEEQLEEFLQSIFASFEAKDPIFFGTMQFAPVNGSKTINIIDGQQRLTTILLLLTVLKENYNNNLNFILSLTTEVDNGKQQEYFKSALAKETDKPTNKYLENKKFIKDYLDKEFAEGVFEEENEKKPFDIHEFIEHLFTKLYFVIIETKAGLSKTLQIFKAINTTGLDLNGSDVFKIRMYEYLTKYKQAESSKAFTDISNLYKLIEDNNRTYAGYTSSMHEILMIYQIIIIGKYDLPNVLFRYSEEKFFEELFDTLLNVKEHEHFNKEKVKDVMLSIEDIQKIIQDRYEGAKEYFLNANSIRDMRIIWESRYSRYWFLVFVAMYQFKLDNANMFKLINRLSRLYFIYSISFDKAINGIHNFNYTLIKDMLHNSKQFEYIITMIEEKIEKDDHMIKDKSTRLARYISSDIFSNAKKKNLICKLSASLEEEATVENMENIFHKVEIDIEHIQARNDENLAERSEIVKEWGSLMNSIGNLMILERTTNRSISNGTYAVKIEGYKKSNFKIVENQIKDYPTEWKKEHAQARREIESKKIINYLIDGIVDNKEAWYEGIGK